MAELLDRAQQLVAAGPYSAATAEVAAVHALLYPDRDAVCQTCRGELGRAYFAIQRWVNQQENSSLTSPSSTLKKSATTARFHSDTLSYTPHGLGVAYSNANLTDKAARYILKSDPDAARHFSTLPAEQEESEDEQVLSPAQASAEKVVEKAETAADTVPTGFDYAKLASAMVDEPKRRSEERTTKFEQDMDDAVRQQPALTASVGGTPEGEAATEVSTDVLDNGVEVTTGQPDTDDQDDEQPVRLSRMNKEQLLAAYHAELNLEPAAGLTNDQLRDAIAGHRAANPA